MHFPIVLFLVFIFTEALSFEKDVIADFIRQEVSDQLRIITEKSNQQKNLIYDLELKLQTKSTEHDRIIHELKETIESLKERCVFRDHGNNFNFSTDVSSDNIGNADVGSGIQNQSSKVEASKSDGRIRINSDQIGVRQKRLLQNSECNIHLLQILTVTVKQVASYDFTIL